MLLKENQRSIAGAIVKVDKSTVTEVTLGVRDGSDEYLKIGVSGIIDYHLHEWAADHHKNYINVGHTRPFPLDGCRQCRLRRFILTPLPGVFY